MAPPTGACPGQEEMTTGAPLLGQDFLGHLCRTHALSLIQPDRTAPARSPGEDKPRTENSIKPDRQGDTGPEEVAPGCSGCKDNFSVWPPSVTAASSLFPAVLGESPRVS